MKTHKNNLKRTTVCRQARMHHSGEHDKKVSSIQAEVRLSYFFSLEFLARLHSPRPVVPSIA